MNIPCYVINLDGHEKNFEKQKPLLVEEGIEPVRFRGVNAKKDEHLDYKDDVTKWCFNTCPKSVIGCGLSHVLLAQSLRDQGVPLALVLEDDAFPKVCDVLAHIQKTIQEVPEDWEIIKLHCLMCVDGSVKNYIGGSSAAYLINASGIEKLSNMKVNFHIDSQMTFSNIKIYKSRYNLFWTDEKTSTNRGNDVPFLRSVKTSSGEQSWSQVLSFYVFRIPIIGFEVKVWQLFLLFLVIIVVFSSA